MKAYSALVVATSALLCGCGAKENGGAQQVGRDVGQAVSEFASGVGQGVDTHLEVTIELSPDAAELGVSKTVAKQSSLGSAGGKTISVYFLAEHALHVNFTVKALNAEGLEIGRATSDVEFGDDDAKYVPFTFDEQMDSQLVDKYVIEVKEVPTADTAGDNPPPVPDEPQ